MSGSRDHFGDKLKQEVLAALALLFRNVDQHPVDLELSAGLTLYLLSLDGEVNNVPLAPMAPAVSQDPISALSALHQAVQTLPVGIQASLGEAGACAVESVLCLEPTFAETPPVQHAVSFESISVRTTQAWTIPVTPPPAVRQKAVLASKTQAKPLGFGNLGKELTDKTRIRKLETGAAGKRSYPVPPHLLGLPLKKIPIPSHRFSPQLKEQFRKALADKAQTIPANIQLRLAFDRMDMTLFTSIAQDEQGNLLCYPKAELIGATTTPQAGNRLKEAPPAYLVFGTRLDTREDIKALVPVASPPRGGEPKST